ncbi:MAG: EscU/YscU/HrcU family type III secretion system export apparatus switch protein [Planctomycetota bacterium]
MAETSGEKTFDATPHRRQQAREKGQVAYSQDLGSAALLMAAALVLYWLGPGVAEHAARMMERLLSEPLAYSVDESLLGSLSRDLGVALAGVMLPLLGLLALCSALSSVSQIGLLFVPQRLAPDINRLNPLEGFKRILSPSGFARLGFGLFKVLVVGAVSGAVLWSRADDVMASGGLAITDLASLLADVTLSAVLWVGVALVLLALADYAFQKWKHEQDLKMSHQEIKEEMKNQQGDPQVAARRKQIQRQMAMGMLSSAVPKADVVVTNPTELAVAIQYNPETMAAPIVVAKGAGVIAQRIRLLALENSIPVVERKPLARLLFKEVDINHPVPDESYAAVAEVLAYVYKLKGKNPPRAPRAA